MTDPHPAPGALRTSLAFATCTLSWGSTFLLIRIGNETMPPLWGAALRLATAALLLNALVLLQRKTLPRGPALRAAALFGLCQFGFNMPLIYWGELSVPSGLAAVVFATIPITSALLARAFGLERLAPLKMLGALVAVAGVAALFADRLAARVTALPLLAIFTASLCAALGNIALKRGPRQDPVGANAVGQTIGVLVCLLASLLFHESRVWPTRWEQLYPILYLAVVGSVGAFVVFAWLLHHWDVSSVAFIGVVVPVIALILGALVRDEAFRRDHLIGSVLVLAGVLLAIASDRRARRLAAAGR